MERKAQKNREKSSTNHHAKIADVGYRCGLDKMLSRCLTSQTIFGTNAKTESFIQSCKSSKRGFSAEMIQLEPLQRYQLGSDNRQKQNYLGMHGSEEEEPVLSPGIGIAN